MNFGYTLEYTDLTEARYAILTDLYNHCALGWPPYVEQRYAIQDPRWLAHMLDGIEL